MIKTFKDLDEQQQRLYKYYVDTNINTDITNVKFLEDNNALFSTLPKNSIGCEIGVLKGDTSRHIYDRTLSKKLHLIDCWEKKYNEYFHWIYVDAGHCYDDCKADLNNFKDKVKNDGYICGHDYDLKAFKGGVVRAVNEFCNQYHWGIIYLTLKMPTAYAIQRIK